MTIDLDKYTETELGEKLKNRLLEIENDDLFVMGVLHSCNDDNKRQKMIEILDKWKISPSDITEISIDIEDDIEPEIEEA